MLAIFAAPGLIGKSQNYTDTPSSSLAINNSYVANKVIAFNCSVKIDAEMIEEFLHRNILESPVDPVSGSYLDSSNPSLYLGFHRDFESTLEFDFGVSRENRNASALWLSAYIGNYIGNSLGYVNELLRRVEIEPENKGTTTKLLVKWRPVVSTLGGLAGFQVVFGLAALLYCRGGFEVVDDVSTLSSMFADFPMFLEEEKIQEGAVHEGKFVRQGDKARWVLSTGVEKDIKVT